MTSYHTTPLCILYAGYYTLTKDFGALLFFLIESVEYSIVLNVQLFHSSTFLNDIEYFRKF
jgi:hypothetical protein